MEIDPLETIEKAKDDVPESQGTSRRLNNAVAVTIALLATFMGVCKVKDDNICQAMQQAQADRLDHWSWYQAHNIRHEVLKSAAETARAEADAIRTEAAANPAALEALESRFNDLAKKQEDDMKDVKEKAQGFGDEYDRLNYRDDQFVHHHPGCAKRYHIRLDQHRVDHESIQRR